MTVTFPGILWDALHQRDESCWLVGNGGWDDCERLRLVNMWACLKMTGTIR